MTDLGIVMPLYYQKEEFIKTSITSILQQSHRDFIFYIVIDGAPDLLPVVEEIVKDDRRVRIIKYTENKGVAHALNIGFNELYKIPDIKYVTWVSSDNIHYPFFLKTLYEGIVDSPPNVGIVYTSFNRILEDGSPAHDEKYLKILHQWQQDIDKMLEGCIIGPSFIHRVDYCRNIGPYRFTLIQDYDYWLRMMDHCQVKYIPVETMEYRLDAPLSLSTGIKNSKDTHRVCWNEVHLAHFETRQRRRIPPEMTIIYFLHDTTQKSLEAYGSVIDQLWSNYRLLLVNCTSDTKLKNLLEKYFDKRVTIFDGGAANPYEEVKQLIKFVKTKYFMLCDGSQIMSLRGRMKVMVKKLEDSSNIVAVVSFGEKLVVKTDISTKRPIPYAVYKSPFIKKLYNRRS